MKARTVLTLATIGVLLIGCASDPSAVSFQVFDRSQPASLEESELFGGLLIEVQETGRTRELSATDFTPNSGPWFAGPTLPVGDSGVVAIRVSLIQEGEVFVTGVVEISLRSNFDWGITVFRQVDDPGPCVACAADPIPFAIPEEFQTEPGEVLWVRVGGSERGVVT